MTSGTVLIVDDEERLVRYLAAALEAEKYQVAIAHDAAQARVKMGEVYPDVVLMDLRLPDADGGELMAQLKQTAPSTKFIVITAHGSIRSAVESTQRGAVDYLTKPFDVEEMLVSIRNVMQGRALDEEVRLLRVQGERTPSCGRRAKPPDLAYPSQAMREVHALAERAAKQKSVVLLLGESGTGKNFLANWIHRNSPRADGPFFTINCAALPRDLAESELFGHEPGSFTGARGRKRGLFELAHEGSLVLDEIGEMDAALQSKLLTFLDTRSFVRVGGERSVSVDVRLIAATNQNLDSMVEQGRFRRDLYYRLNVLPIRMPSLRERLEDIAVLVEDILDRLQSDMGLTRQLRLEDAALDALRAYSWPGNIRELRNALERALMLSPDDTIRRADLAIAPTSAEWQLTVKFPAGRNLHAVTADVARALIREALRRVGTKQEAAELLGITRHALAHQIRVLGVDDA